jgi:two-component system, OmpR family, response regulator
LRILLVDDDAALSTMLTEYLGGEGFEVHPLTNGRDALAAVQSGRYDAVLLDVMMPEISGIEVLRQLRQRSAIPILMLTAKGDDIDRIVGLEMGADDYISKPFLTRELLARLKAVLRRTATGSSAMQSEQLQFSDLVLAPNQRSVSWRTVPLVLTASEFRLLELLVRAAGSLVTKTTLSEKALGRRHESYDRSVDVHIGRLRQKLASLTDGRMEIRTIRGAGYALESAT